MVYDLCNLYEQDNLDTFHEINIISTKNLPEFNDLDKNDDVLSLINSLPQEHNILRIPLMPEKYSVRSETRILKNNKKFETKINFPLTPQDRNLKQILDMYNNQTVVVFLKRHLQSQLYGTGMQPLLMTYEELHSSKSTGLKGFTLNIEGTTYGASRYFTAAEVEDSPIVQGLAFELAGSL